MNFVLDVHCHTISSGHAYSTISENAEHAAKIGMKYIGVSDHAPAMPGASCLYNFTNLWSLPDVIGGVRVFKGVECNILDERGQLDLSTDLLAKMEFVIASFHRGTFPPSDKATHTRAMIAAMENNRDMHILGHPGDPFFEIDIPAVVSAAARTHTIIEINNQSLNPRCYRYNGSSVPEKILELCKKIHVPVIASSDAHFATYVGELGRAQALIEASGIDEELVVNTSVERFLAAIAKKRELF
ncbi:MAG: phosphatase [Defluviitaleaceae bacterium]|nr:phosphatase [Defluviitaleaceae bacterium]